MRTKFNRRKIDFSVRGIISRCLKPGDSIQFRLMCRDRGSVLFYPRKTLPTISKKSEFEDLMDEINRQQYAHLLSADDQTVLDEIIEKEKFQLLKQLEEDGDQPEACFIRQALEENNVKISTKNRHKTKSFSLGTRKISSRTKIFRCHEINRKTQNS